VGSDLGGDLTAWLCQSVRIDMRGGYWLHVAKHAGLSGPTRPVSCVDCLHQTANAQNLHHAFHVVGQDVQRHFGADVLERFHLEVRRSHPRLYRAERMLDRLAPLAHFLRVLVEPALHRLEK
jgi:hypothetical protein